MGKCLKVIGGLFLLGVLALAGSLLIAYMQSSAPIHYAETFSRNLIEANYSESTFCAGIPNAKGATEEAMRTMVVQIGKPISYSAASLSRINLSDGGRQYFIEIPVHFENFDGQLLVVVSKKANQQCIAGWRLYDVKRRSVSTTKS
jgi:hypothetical protein